MIGENTACELGNVEAPMGVINEIKQRANERLDFARNVSQRIQDLRIRLIGHVPEECEAETDPKAPTAEVEQLADAVNTMNAVLSEIDRNLGMLERL